MITIGYNTNGFANHSLVSAIDIIGSIGYKSVAITLDHHSLNPWSPRLDEEIAEVKALLLKYDLSCMVETGARFLLNPRHKHEPTLISIEKDKRDIRIDFLNKAIDIAARIGASAVSIWSGIKSDDVSNQQAWKWLITGCRAVARTASDSGVALAFEPEPGMFVENLSQYARLKKDVASESFRLTLDLGHAFITEKSVSDSIYHFKNDIINIHLEDMKKNKHEHLFFGDGDMDFDKILGTVKEIKFKGQVNIELSRNSHNAVDTAVQSYEFLKKYMGI